MAYKYGKEVCFSDLPFTIKEENADKKAIAEMAAFFKDVYGNEPELLKDMLRALKRNPYDFIE